MAFPAAPLSGITATGNFQANTTATRTFPNLSAVTNVAGDLMIAICVAYQSNVTNAAFSGWTAGWTEFIDQSTTTGMAIGAAYKWSTGGETGAISVTQAATITGHAGFLLMSISGAHPSTPPEATAIANGTSAAANPVALDPAGWGTEDTLWLSIGALGETSLTGTFDGIASQPANYSNSFGTGISGDAIGAIHAAAASRQLNAASEDVGTWTLDTANTRNSALVIAVRPAAGATPISATDAFAVTEAAPTVGQFFSKGAAETFAVSDLSAPSAAADRTDSFTATEATPAILGTAALADALVLTEGLASVSIQNLIAATDSAALAEAFGLQGLLAKTDTASLADASALLQALTASDAFTFTDSGLASEFAVKVASDAFALSETASILEQLLKAANDSFVLAELSSASSALSASDAFVASDLSSLTALLAKVDSAALSDVAVLLETVAKAANDSATLAESASLLQQLIKATSDSFALAELSSTSSALTRTDAFVASDLAALTALLAKVDAATLSDSAVLLETVAKVAADSATLSDAAAIAATAIAVDAATLSEALDLSGSSTVSKSANDSFTLLDVASLTETVFRAVSDVLAVTESKALTAELTRQDGGTLQEVLSMAAQLLATENATASEIASIAAVLATSDQAAAVDLASVNTVEFVQMVSALVTAAVTLQGMTTALTDGPTSAEAVQAEMPGAGSAEIDEATGATSVQAALTGSTEVE